MTGQGKVLLSLQLGGLVLCPIARDYFVVSGTIVYTWVCSFTTAACMALAGAQASVDYYTKIPTIQLTHGLTLQVYQCYLFSYESADK